jgi:hypothetical protein
MLYGQKKTFSLYEVQGMSKRAINKHFRTTDESNLWPICGKFNATERAIRRVRRFQSQTGTPIEGLEYWLALESEISAIVNKQV